MIQQEKAAIFLKLHQTPGAFVIANAWDGGSARILEKLSFAALATSSGAAAATLGRLDGGVSRQEALRMAQVIAASTHLPVSADLEKGFGDSPDIVAETIRLAAAAGLVRCTIEDTTGNRDRPLYDFSLADECITAGAEAARRLGFPFLLTTRAHTLMYAK